MEQHPQLAGTASTDRVPAPPAGAGRVPPANPASAEVPFWLQRLAALGWRMLVILAFAVIIVLLLWAIWTTTAAVILAFVVSATVAPLYSGMRARGWGASRAAAAATLVAGSAVVLVLLVLAWVAIAYGPEVVRSLRDGLAWVDEQAAAGAIPQDVADAINSIVSGLRDWLTSHIGELIGSVMSYGTILLFGAFTMFFLLSDANRGWAWLMQGAGQERREAALETAERVVVQTGGYFRTVAVTAGVKGLVAFVLLLLFGVPVPFALGTFVAAAAFVPYFGSIVSTVVILLIALATVGVAPSLVLVGLIIAATLVEPLLINRLMGGRAVHLNPALIIIAAAIGGFLAGLAGVILAVPIAAGLLAAGTSVTEVIAPEAEDAAPVVVPPWLDVLAQWSWRLLVAVALVGVATWAVVQIPVVVMPLVIAAVLGASFAPVVGWLVRRGAGRAVATAVVVSGVTAGIIGLLAISAASIFAGLGEVFGQTGTGAGDIDDAAGGLAGLLRDLIEEFGPAIIETVATVSTNLAVFALVIALGVLMTFFAILDGPSVWATLTRHLAAWRRNALTEAATSSVSVLGGYMVGTGIVSFFGAATQFVLMVLLGVPFALPVFVLSLFGGYIPYFGSAITTGIAFLLTVSTGNVPAIAIMLIFTIVFNIVQGNILQPLVFSRAVNIHPAIVLLGIPAGGALAGIAGMFLVVPVLGVIAATWRTVLVVLGQPPQAGAAATAGGGGPGGPEVVAGGQGDIASGADTEAPASSSATETGEPGGEGATA